MTTPITVADSSGDRCTCGWPDRFCLRRVLSNGPPFPSEPCEPAITLGDHHRAPREQVFPAGVLVALCELLEDRRWRYYDEQRREWIGYDFTAQLAALGWRLPDEPSSCPKSVAFLDRAAEASA